MVNTELTTKTAAMRRIETRRASGQPVIGLALGSGAARGWAHAGVMDALDELGVTVDVHAGCSVGSIVTAARHLGIWDEFLDWAKGIGSFSTWSSFAVGLGAGGLVNPEPAFKRFRKHDRPIETLDRPWGAVATDLASGQEVWLTSGSVLDACRASAAIPLLMHAASYQVNGEQRWLIDGAASNPVPVSLARALGADRVISVDINAVSSVLDRFNRPTTRAVVPVEAVPVEEGGVLPKKVAEFFRDTKSMIDRELAMAKAKADASPHLFETVVATLDIVQTHLSLARAQVDIADVRISPDMADAPPTAFDRFDEYRKLGYDATMKAADDILALIVPGAPEGSAIAPPPLAASEGAALAPPRDASGRRPKT